jgi:hypothetical protein
LGGNGTSIVAPAAATAAATICPHCVRILLQVQLVLDLLLLRSHALVFGAQHVHLLRHTRLQAREETLTAYAAQVLQHCVLQSTAGTVKQVGVF